MTRLHPTMRTVVKERSLPHKPDRVWRALTQSHLVAEWLMPCDLVAEVGHRFELEAPWGKVLCQVLAVEPERLLSYSWAAQGLESVVTWTLTETASGTDLRLEQTGFGIEQEQAYRGATAGWTRFLGRLEAVIAGLDGEARG